MRYTAKKIATMLLTMVIVSFLTFVAFSLLSGDAATRLLGTEATPERLEALRIELGLNDPLLVRYGRWLWDALRGDLGTSYRYGQSVSSLIAQRLGPTLTLTALAFALIVAVSIPLGVLSAKYAGGRLDRALTVINQVVMAVPPFFTGILFTYLFGLVLHLFIAGAFPAGGVGHYIGYLFFPALAVALPRIAMTVKRICEAITRDEKPILPVSNYIDGEYGLHDIVLSMPAVVGASGIEYQVPIKINETETEQLKASAATLRSVIDKLDL